MIAFATVAVLAFVLFLLAGRVSAQNNAEAPPPPSVVEPTTQREATPPPAPSAEPSTEASRASGAPSETSVEQTPATAATPPIGSDANVPADPGSAPMPVTTPSTPDPSPAAEHAEPTPVASQLSAESTAPSVHQPASPPKSGALPHDLSPWGMFMAADFIVKAVMIGLAAASFITWTIWVAKTFEISTAKWRLKRAIREIAAAPDLATAVEIFGRRRSTSATLVRTAAEELARSLPALEHVGPDGIKERMTSRLSRVEANAGRRMTLGTGVLATIGSTAPFVGLFGTVWGIMNSFIGISQTQTTNLAVVAPGIAEALLATAMGLVAAIPAVIIYNVFARSIAGYRLLLLDASAGVEQLVSWELDARRLPHAAFSHLHSRAAE